MLNNSEHIDTGVNMLELQNFLFEIEKFLTGGWNDKYHDRVKKQLIIYTHVMQTKLIEAQAKL
jgi:hypothetical protein